MSEKTATKKTAAKKAAEPEQDHADIEAILPAPSDTFPVDGIDCRVRRLKTREFLLLVQVMTSGLGAALSDMKLDLTDEDSVQRDLAALMLLAIPNAVDEFSMFLRAIVEPVDDRERGKVAAYLMDNPDIDVMLDVFERVAAQEKDDLVVLAGKAQAMWSRLSALYTK